MCHGVTKNIVIGHLHLRTNYHCTWNDCAKTNNLFQMIAFMHLANKTDFGGACQ